MKIGIYFRLRNEAEVDMMNYIIHALCLKRQQNGSTTTKTKYTNISCKNVDFFSMFIGDVVESWTLDSMWTVPYSIV